MVDESEKSALKLARESEEAWREMAKTSRSRN
jgi:hypothetical protein